MKNREGAIRTRRPGSKSSISPEVAPENEIWSALKSGDEMVDEFLVDFRRPDFQYQQNIVTPRQVRTGSVMFS